MKFPTKQTIFFSLLALLIVAIAAWFSVEPLFSLISNSRQFPAGTTILLKIPAKTQSADIVAKSLNILRSQGFALLDSSSVLDRIGAILLPAVTGPKTAIFSAGTTSYPIAVTLTSPTKNTNPILDAMRRLIAFAVPTEQEIRLPDESKSIEIVADPSKVVLTYEKRGQIEQWTANGLKTPLSFRKTPIEFGISTASPTWETDSTYYIPTSCLVDKTGILTITTIPGNSDLLNTAAMSFFAYLRDYSCFQSFSTYAAK